MRLRRLTLKLPASMKDTAHHDARAIAQSIALQLHKNGGAASDVTLQGHGQSAALLAQRVAGMMPKGSNNGR